MLVRVLKSGHANPTPLRSDVDHVVLEVICLPYRKANYYRIEPRDGGAPGFHDSRLFEITSRTIPASWVAHGGEDGCISFTPEPWTVDGFWEAFFDREEWAVQIYFRNRDELLKELPDSMSY